MNRVVQAKAGACKFGNPNRTLISLPKIIDLSNQPVSLILAIKRNRIEVIGNRVDLQVVIRVRIVVPIFDFIHERSKPVVDTALSRNSRADQFDVGVRKLVGHDLPDVQRLGYRHVRLRRKLRFVEAKHVINMDAKVVL